MKIHGKNKVFFSYKLMSSSSTSNESNVYVLPMQSVIAKNIGSSYADGGCVSKALEWIIGIREQGSSYEKSVPLDYQRPIGFQLHEDFKFKKIPSVGRRVNFTFGALTAQNRSPSVEVPLPQADELKNELKKNIFELNISPRSTKNIVERQVEDELEYVKLADYKNMTKEEQKDLAIPETNDNDGDNSGDFVRSVGRELLDSLRNCDFNVEMLNNVEKSKEKPHVKNKGFVKRHKVSSSNPPVTVQEAASVKIQRCFRTYMFKMEIKRHIKFNTILKPIMHIKSWRESFKFLE
jgi:hypothetical protein